MATYGDSRSAVRQQRMPQNPGAASAAQLDARAELLAPLALVGLAPLQLALLEGLAADDDLEAGVLVRRAGDALEVASRHRSLAPEALAVRRGLGGAREHQENEHNEGLHRPNGLNGALRRAGGTAGSG